MYLIKDIVTKHKEFVVLSLRDEECVLFGPLTHTFWGKGFLATQLQNSKPRPQKDKWRALAEERCEDTHPSFTRSHRIWKIESMLTVTLSLPLNVWHGMACHYRLSYWKVGWYDISSVNYWLLINIQLSHLKNPHWLVRHQKLDTLTIFRWFTCRMS